MSERGLSLEEKRRKAMQQKIDDFRALVLARAYGPAGPFFPIKNNYRFAPLNLKGFFTTRYAGSSMASRDKNLDLPQHEI